MVIKVYTSGISGNKEVKKRQQRIMMILESKNIDYEAIDITEPGKESDKQFMQDNAKARNSKHPLPPQIFNEDDYCGDYEGFDLANENDELEIFLKLPLPPAPVPPVVKPPVEPPPPVVNGHEHHTEKESSQPPEIERHEDVIDNVIENLVNDKKEEEPEEIVHGFCYTPALAKRLERAIKMRIMKEKPKPVHGYCFTPSLAQRLAKALERSYLKEKEEEKQSDVNSEDEMDEDKQESEPSMNDEEMDEGNEEEQNGNEDNASDANEAGDGDGGDE